MYDGFIHTEFAALLQRNGYWQTDFAKLCGVTNNAVNNWCRGRRGIPRWAWVIASTPMSSVLTDTLAFTCQETLGVSYPRTPASAAKARATLAKKYHPDAGGRHEQMVRINNAYDVARKKWPA
jgi:hypothetical protein